MPPAGRDLVRKILTDANVTFSFYEIAWAQRKAPLASILFLSSASLLPAPAPIYARAKPALDAFIRDELSKGRYDPGIAAICFAMLTELFNRTLRSDLGPRSGGEMEPEDVC